MKGATRMLCAVVVAMLVVSGCCGKACVASQVAKRNVRKLYAKKNGCGIRTPFIPAELLASVGASGPAQVARLTQEIALVAEPVRKECAGAKGRLGFGCIVCVGRRTFMRDPDPPAKRTTATLSFSGTRVIAVLEVLHLCTLLHSSAACAP